MKSKYFTFYSILLILLFGSIAGRIYQVKTQEKTIPPSITKYWQDHGIPVRVATAQRQDYIIEQPCYAMMSDKFSFICYLPLSQAEQVVPGALFRSAERSDFSQQNLAIKGTVTKVNRPEEDVGITEIRLKIDPASITPEQRKSLAYSEHTTHFAEIYVQGPKYPNSIFVPQDAVQNIDGKNYVWLAVQGTAQQKEVRLGVSDDKNVQILQGLNPGDQVIIQGQSKVAAQTKLNILAKN